MLLFASVNRRTDVRGDNRAVTQLSENLPAGAAKGARQHSHTNSETGMFHKMNKYMNVQMRSRPITDSMICS